MTTSYRINWDNGNHACGTFPQEYDTEEAAQAAADDILASNLADGTWSADDEEDGMGVEVIEEKQPDPEEIDAAEEQTLDYFNHFIAGDR